MTTDVHLLMISGSTRAGSTNTAALRTAALMTPADVPASLYDGLADLPAFNPDDDHDPLPGAVADLRQQIAACDAVVFCTPEYAGSFPGSFKNLLDWCVGGTEIYRKPAAWINVAAEGRGTNAHAALATVLGYVGAEIIEAACVRVPVPHQAVGPDGLIADDGARSQIGQVLQTIAQHVRRAAPVE